MMMHQWAHDFMAGNDEIGLVIVPTGKVKEFEECYEGRWDMPANKQIIFTDHEEAVNDNIFPILKDFRQSKESPFTVGTYYRTRGGQQGFYMGCSPYEVSHSYDKHLFAMEEGGYQYVNSEGFYYPEVETPNDIVEEWREPKKVWVWYNKMGISEVTDVKELSDDMRNAGADVKEVCFDE